jgi:hypothetical protein
MAKYVCPTHQTEQDSYCAACVVDMDDRRDAALMTPDEREAEFRRWCGILTVPFDRVHGRIEELVGRPVWTHEMGLNVEGLIAEARARTCEPATLEKVMNPLMTLGASAPEIIVVEVPIEKS